MRGPTRRDSLTVVPVPGHGAEDVLGGENGSVYTGTEDGAVWRVLDDGVRLERVGDTGGRPLGLEWLADGRLLSATSVTGCWPSTRAPARGSRSPRRCTAAG